MLFESVKTYNKMTIGTDDGIPNIEQFRLFIRTLDWRKSEGENAFRTGKNASCNTKLILQASSKPLTNLLRYSSRNLASSS